MCDKWFQMQVGTEKEIEKMKIKAIRANAEVGGMTQTGSAGDDKPNLTEGY
jgi:hypothetical protein